MILTLTLVFVALPLTLFVLAGVLPFFGCVSGASEFELQSHDSHLQGNVDRTFSRPAGTVVVIDVECGEILAPQNLHFAGKQLIRPGSTGKPLVLSGLLDSGRLDPKGRLICPRASHRGMRLDCDYTPGLSQLDEGDAMVVYVPEGRGGHAAIVTQSVFEEYPQIKKKP